MITQWTSLHARNPGLELQTIGSGSWLISGLIQLLFPSPYSLDNLSMAANFGVFIVRLLFIVITFSLQICGPRGCNNRKDTRILALIMIVSEIIVELKELLLNWLLSDAVLALINVDSMWILPLIF